MSYKAFADAARQFKAVKWKSLASVRAGIFDILTIIVPELLKVVLKLLHKDGNLRAEGSYNDLLTRCAEVDEIL